MGLSGSNRYPLIIALVVCCLSAAYVVHFVDRGWLPHDEGALAQSAERVLEGELPHRDFDEPYTGALSYLHALGFKLLGTRLVSLRYVLLLFFLLFVPALYSLALKVAPPLVAGLVTLLGVVWSVPNYFAGVPSWYNLFLATFGTFALYRHVETHRPVWLFLAGLCGGLSFLVKVVGLYYIAGAILFLIYREQLLSPSTGNPQPYKLSSFLIFKGAFFILFVVLLIFPILAHMAPMEVLHFLIPGSTVIGYLLWTEAREARGAFRQRLGSLFRLLRPFVLGIAAPVALFLTPYLLSGSMLDLYRGLFLLPQKRLENASVSLPPAYTLLPSIPYAAILLFPMTSGNRQREKIYALSLILVLGIALLFHRAPAVAQNVWFSVRNLPVIAVLAGLAFLLRSEGSGAVSPEKRQAVFLLTAMAALVSLVQFPFASPIYFCYTAPIIVLLIATLVFAQPTAPRWLHAIVLCFYLAFALLRMNPGYVGGNFFPYRPESFLDLPRGGLRVYEPDSRMYKQLLTLIKDLEPGQYLYAAPDCPEVYFLSGLKNPTRTIFDFFDDPNGKAARLQRILDDSRVKVVVVDRLPVFSGPLDPEILSMLETTYAHSQAVGRFVVRWKS
jgi:hypothetical protein